MVEWLFLTTASGSEIPCFHLSHPTAEATIIFSHGNSTDIGYMLPHLLDMATTLQVCVFAYEYSGYGASVGEPSESGIYSDIEAAYDWVVHRRRRPPASVVLYGQSVGSAASIHLAAKAPVGGLVVHSGLKSGITAIRSHYDKVHWFDAFKNIEKIRAVACPLLVIHGKRDADIAVDHGRALYAAARTARFRRAWWVDGGGHNDIESDRRAAYFERLTSFFAEIGLLPRPAADSPLAARPRSRSFHTKADADKRVGKPCLRTAAPRLRGDAEVPPLPRGDAAVWEGVEALLDWDSPVLPLLEADQELYSYAASLPTPATAAQ